MTEKNEISYSKAMNLMKAYYQQEQYRNQNISNTNFINQVTNKSKVNSSTEFINKSSSNINTYAIKDDLILIDDKESRLNQQIVQGLSNMKNNPQHISQINMQQNKERILNKTPSQTGSSFQNKNEAQSKQDAEKQNISIVLINNHINRYIINNQDANQNSQENAKKPKNNINTFRSSYQLGPNQMTESQMNKKGPTELRQNNMAQPGLSQNNSKLNLKNLNIDVRSPMMKNSTPTEQLGPTKYSSLLDNQMRGNTPNNSSSYNQVGRPSSAVAMKGRHTREASAGSFKNENPQSYHSIVRSPSSQNIAHGQGLNRNFSKTSVNQKKETPRNNYFISNYDVSKSIGIGNKTVRPSSTNDRIRMNYTGNINPLSSMNNINHIKVANRYDIDELVNRRGYSLSSRATDLKPSYRFKEYEQKYHTPSNIFCNSRQPILCFWNISI
jgi:hypothetical protein